MDGNFIIQDGTLKKYCGEKDVSEIFVPDGVVRISRSAFDELRFSLREITMPESLCEIFSNVFSGFQKLEKVYFSSNPIVIGESCFWNCKNLSEIVNAESIVKIGEGAFSRTKIKKIFLPNVESLGLRAFENCPELQTVVLSEKLKYLPYECFSFCESLKEVQIPEGVERIYIRAFADSPVPCITLPSTVCKIGEYGREEIFSPLTKITIASQNPYYEVVDNVIREKSYHEEGGLYTVVGEYDKGGRCVVATDASTNERYFLRRIRYSEEEMTAFNKVCDSYCFEVYEKYFEGNDDLDIETEISTREPYSVNIPITDAVVKDGEIIGFMCETTFLRIAPPRSGFTEKTNHESLSAYRYTYTEKSYYLASKSEAVDSASEN